MGVVLAVVVCTALGVVIERLAYKPLRMAPSLAVLITAIGVSYFLQNAALLIWSSNPKTFHLGRYAATALSLFGGQMQISKVTLVAIAACVVIMVALMLFTGKSKVRHGDACGFRGQGRGPADGHQRQHDHFASPLPSAPALPLSRACCCAPRTRP